MFVHILTLRLTLTMTLATIIIYVLHTQPYCLCLALLFSIAVGFFVQPHINLPLTHMIDQSIVAGKGVCVGGLG